MADVNGLPCDLQFENLMKLLAARGAWAGPALEGAGDILESTAFSAVPSSLYRECQGDTISAGGSPMGSAHHGMADPGDAPPVREMGRLSVGPGSTAMQLPDRGTSQAMPEAAPCTPSAELEGDELWNADADVSSCPAPSPIGDGVGALLQAAQEAKESPKRVASANRKPVQARRKRKPTKRAAPDDGDSDAEADVSEPEGAKKPAK